MKIQLKKVTIEKYTCIESTQQFPVDSNITVLVGMNESGKTSVLKALAKTNYFTDDKDFKFDKVHDYPRKEKKALDKSGDNPVAVIAEYELSDELISLIKADIGDDTFDNKLIRFLVKYSNDFSYENVNTNNDSFINFKLNTLGAGNPDQLQQLAFIKNKAEFEQFQNELADDELKKKINKLGKYFENKWGWDNPIAEYIVRVHIAPNMPRFLYYDEYYALPSVITIEKIADGKRLSDENKTAKALFELADINIEELVKDTDFESYKAELEATQAAISDTLFQYWTTNTNIEIHFDVEKILIPDPNYHNHHKLKEHLLHVRVKNKRTTVTLPLHNRSRGFNWFFSFLVWFKKIQEDKEHNYILLLDEPGLNLHASAQADLLRFMEDLSAEYQIIYTTHSPFMIDSEHLDRVRTVLDTSKGSVISDSTQEKDPNTLFPLQAALGYTLAQNLFISPKNLLVEGVSDLIYLTILSGILNDAGRTGLKEDITIVPAGGLDKVATFISLMRGNNLEIACLLDSFTDPGSEARLKNMIAEKLIRDKRVKSYHEFTGTIQADIEDLFEPAEYLVLFNETFNGKYRELKPTDLNDKIEKITMRINKALGIDRFNHYGPANFLQRKSPAIKDFNPKTLDRFERLFGEINKLF